MVEYLKKSGRIALNCDDNLELKAQLLVELLNNYMYFYEKNNGEVCNVVCAVCVHALI